MDKMLTPQECAEALRTTVETLAVWRATKRVKVPYLKLGAKVLYREKDVEKFLESGASQ